eukprot:TRINITY_DN115_c1_g1_i1.p1 TRINITY_DN115_c1_g1~~TRINITY_DN115_c1_g1_i1.p1  ORF type:complete len:1029 (-),score=310.65 TRINITY_DN115_c1_g1_i1:59-3082(-)
MDLIDDVLNIVACGKLIAKSKQNDMLWLYNYLFLVYFNAGMPDHLYGLMVLLKAQSLEVHQSFFTTKLTNYFHSKPKAPPSINSSIPDTIPDAYWYNRFIADQSAFVFGEYGISGEGISFPHPFKKNKGHIIGLIRDIAATKASGDVLGVMCFNVLTAAYEFEGKLAKLSTRAPIRINGDKFKLMTVCLESIYENGELESWISFKNVVGGLGLKAVPGEPTLPIEQKSVSLSQQRESMSRFCDSIAANPVVDRTISQIQSCSRNMYNPNGLFVSPVSPDYDDKPQVTIFANPKGEDHLKFTEKGALNVVRPAENWNSMMGGSLDLLISSKGQNETERGMWPSDNVKTVPIVAPPIPTLGLPPFVLASSIPLPLSGSSVYSSANCTSSCHDAISVGSFHSVDSISHGGSVFNDGNATNSHKNSSRRRRKRKRSNPKLKVNTDDGDLAPVLKARKSFSSVQSDGSVSSCFTPTSFGNPNVDMEANSPLFCNKPTHNLFDSIDDLNLGNSKIKASTPDDSATVNSYWSDSSSFTDDDINTSSVPSFSGNEFNLSRGSAVSFNGANLTSQPPVINQRSVNSINPQSYNLAPNWFVPLENPATSSTSTPSIVPPPISDIMNSNTMVPNNPVRPLLKAKLQTETDLFDIQSSAPEQLSELRIQQLQQLQELQRIREQQQIQQQKQIQQIQELQQQQQQQQQYQQQKHQQLQQPPSVQYNYGTRPLQQPPQTHSHSFVSGTFGNPFSTINGSVQQPGFQPILSNDPLEVYDSLSLISEQNKKKHSTIISKGRGNQTIISGVSSKGDSSIVSANGGAYFMRNIDENLGFLGETGKQHSLTDITTTSNPNSSSRSAITIGNSAIPETENLVNAFGKGMKISGNGNTDTEMTTDTDDDDLDDAASIDSTDAVVNMANQPQQLQQQHHQPSPLNQGATSHVDQRVQPHPQLYVGQQQQLQLEQQLQQLQTMGQSAEITGTSMSGSFPTSNSNIPISMVPMKTINGTVISNEVKASTND